MTELTKRWSSPAVVETFQRVSKDRPWIRTGFRNRGSNASATAVFSRPKPSTLRPTHMIISRSEWNSGTYRNPAETRMGVIEFAFPQDVLRHRRVTTSTGRAADIAYVDAKSRLAKGSLNMAQSLAESRETFGTIITNLYRIGAFAKALKKGDISKAASVLDIKLSRRGKARLQRQTADQRMSNGWLEFQYGIMPIVADVEGAVELLDTKFHVGASRTAYGGLSLKQQNLARDLSDVANWSVEGDNIELAPRYTIRGEVSNPNLRRAQELGFLNLAALAWELFPLSFVVDWFSTIGSWVNSLTHGAGLNGVWGVRTSYTSSTSYLRGRGFVYRTEGIARTPVPPVVSIPWLLRRQAMKGSQIASAAALIRQRL